MSGRRKIAPKVIGFLPSFLQSGLQAKNEARQNLKSWRTFRKSLNSVNPPDFFLFPCNTVQKVVA